MIFVVDFFFFEIKMRPSEEPMTPRFTDKKKFQKNLPFPNGWLAFFLRFTLLKLDRL